MDALNENVHPEWFVWQTDQGFLPKDEVKRQLEVLPERQVRPQELLLKYARQAWPRSDATTVIEYIAVELEADTTVLREFHKTQETEQRALPRPARAHYYYESICRY